MPDIRDVLKGLSVDDRALYSEVRTVMRRAYLSAHAKLLPIDQYDAQDDAFLDLIDIKIAILFDRAGVFNSAEGNLDTDTAKEIEQKTKEAFQADIKLPNTDESAATKLMRQPTPQQPWNDKLVNGWSAQ